jgi:hypothetical protein
MIIWSRWGIVVLLFAGLGVGLGFAIAAVVGVVERSGPVNGVFVGIGMLLSAALLFVFNRVVVGKHIDKPKPAVMYEQLPQPVVDQNNVRQTHRVIPILHPETGQQVMTNPVSTFFFIPLRYWPFILGALAVVILLVNLVGVLTR